MMNRYEKTPITVQLPTEFTNSYDAIDLSLYYHKLGFPSF